MPIRPEMRARYPSDWALRSRFVRFVRAGGRCEWCGAVHGQPHPVTGSLVVLTAAHVHDHRPDGNETMSENDKLFSDQINAAIDAAKGELSCR